MKSELFPTLTLICTNLKRKFTSQKESKKYSNLTPIVVIDYEPLNPGIVWCLKSVSIQERNEFTVKKDRGLRDESRFKVTMLSSSKFRSNVQMDIIEVHQLATDLWDDVFAPEFRRSGGSNSTFLFLY